MSTPWLLVLAGGSGTRFWPLSRARLPKQFLAIAGEEPLVATTLRRFSGWIPEEKMAVLTTQQLAADTKALLGDFSGLHILAEPEARNTFPTVVMAMEWLRARDPKATAVIVPADHWITENQEYLSVMRAAVAAAEESGRLCTVGIQPTRPETGYGYIRLGPKTGQTVYRADRFVEKPSREVAETMVQSSNYLWNAGMFVWTVETFFRELQEHAPLFAEAFRPYGQAVAAGKDKKEVETIAKQAFAAVPAISIDYALLEKSKEVAVVPGSSFGWNDLGSFVSLEEVYPKVEGGVARAERVLALDSLANIIHVPGKTVALLGVTDMIVVDTGDVLLLAAKERAQDVKKIVERLRQEQRADLV